MTTRVHGPVGLTMCECGQDFGTMIELGNHLSTVQAAPVHIEVAFTVFDDEEPGTLVSRLFMRAAELAVKTLQAVEQRGGSAQVSRGGFCEPVYIEDTPLPGVQASFTFALWRTTKIPSPVVGWHYVEWSNVS